MIHLVRKEYWYTDEYILEKSFGWLKDSVEIISEDRYNQNLQLSWLVQLHIWQIMSSEKINIPTRKEMQNKKPPDEIKDDDLWDFWIWI